MSDVSVTLGSSNGLVELARLLAQGTEVEGAEIEVYSIGRIVDEFQFSGDVAMTALKSVDATENELSFSFTEFAQGHQSYDASGAQAGTVGHAPDPEALGAPVAPDVTSPPSLQYFMRAHGLTDWIELKGFSFDMANASGDDGGLAMSDVTATMSTGSGAAKLFQAMAEGRPIASIEIEAYTRDVAPQLVDEFTFDSAQLTRHDVDTQAEVGTSHTVRFGFAEFGHTHVEQRDAAGNIISQESMTTDASDPTGPAATADALQGARETVVGSKLESYLRVEGVGAPNEWLLLNSYSLALENPASGAGSAVLRDLEVGVGSSGPLVELTDALASGRLFDYAELEVYRLFEGAKIVDEFKFEDLAVSELLSTTATRNTLAFDYADVSYAHATAYDAETGEVAGWAGGHTPDADLF
jgi:type VI protein secretion system component Hcp